MVISVAAVAASTASTHTTGSLLNPNLQFPIQVSASRLEVNRDPALISFASSKVGATVGSQFCPSVGWRCKRFSTYLYTVPLRGIYLVGVQVLYSIEDQYKLVLTGATVPDLLNRQLLTTQLSQAVKHRIFITFITLKLHHGGPNRN